MAKKASVTVKWNGGTREYNAEDHGKNYKKLAEECPSSDDLRQVAA